MKFKTKSFRFKLWMCFLLFTLFIFILLWMLQTAFLQYFYNRMIISNTKEAAETIKANSDSENIDDIIDELARDNSILVFITDNSGDILYSSDKFSYGRGKNKSEGGSRERRGNENQKNIAYRDLPDGYDDFLDKLKSSDGGEVEYDTDSMFICGTYLETYEKNENAVLYVSAAIEAVGAPVTIIKKQLIWVTALSVAVGFILAWFIAKSFSRPISELSEKVKKIGEKEYPADIKPGFCSELDELNCTLDATNVKLIEAKEYQTELLANVSHDLRTPITMIKGYAEMIRDISREDDEQRKEDIAVIVKEADRLTALINEILEYSELKANETAKELIPTNLSQITGKTLDGFEALYKPSGITLSRSVESGVYVKGDAQMLTRVILNLLDNAARHAGEDKTVRASLFTRGDTAVIEIADNGDGISESDLYHIWDRYYTSRQRNGKGVSGLGLAIVKQITELHGGKCSVRSSKGNGSTFTVELGICGKNA